jgi:hypothetical protein
MTTHRLVANNLVAGEDQRTTQRGLVLCALSGAGTPGCNKVAHHRQKLRLKAGKALTAEKERVPIIPRDSPQSLPGTDSVQETGLIEWTRERERERKKEREREREREKERERERERERGVCELD